MNEFATISYITNIFYFYFYFFIVVIHKPHTELVSGSIPSGDKNNR